jgi:uncharacterized protein YfiM (DUF2279 family)
MRFGLDRRVPSLLVALVFAVCTGGVLAGSARATAPCPNEQARAEQPYGLELPDCRAYEMVSPLDKNDNNISSVNSRASVSGEALTYLSTGSFSEPQGASGSNRYISRRAADGWSTQNITTPHLAYNTHTNGSFEELFFTPDLSMGLTESRFIPLVAGDAPGYDRLYVAEIEDGSYQTVTTITPPEEPYVPDTDRSYAGGVSTDLSHVVFREAASLTAGASSEKYHVYEWAGGKLSLVDVPPAGVEFTSGYDASLGAPSEGASPETGDAWHAVSGNGLRVFFTAGEKSGSSLGQLYVRENPMSSTEDCSVSGDACTVEVSASQRTVPDPNASKAPYAFYRDASANGGRVFFTSRVELTNEAYTGTADNAANLYEYDLESGVLTDLTVDDEAATDGAAVLGLVTAGEDGSYVYFVANGVLASNENGNKEKAQPGDCKEKEFNEAEGERTCNLYVEHYNGTGWEPAKFIATLAGAGKGYGAFNLGRDEEDWIGNETQPPESQPEADLGPAQHTVRVTPDGATLAFQSERSLTAGYDNEQAEPGECGVEDLSELIQKCSEVYLYNAETERLVCASCDQSGAQPVGPAQLGGKEHESAESLVAPSDSYLPRNLSEDGGRLFFQSPDALVPHDSDGLLDVYEWEAEGEGSCVQAAGCVYPISDVAGDNESRFMDASPDGNDVFIATGDQLVPSDTDTRIDVYDVRAGGGFPVSAPAPVCTNGDSCKGPVSPQPGVFGAPASATFSGAGNLVPEQPAVVKPKPKSKPAKCKKGFVKKKDKCVKKPKSKKAKKSAKGRK